MGLSGDARLPGGGQGVDSALPATVRPFARRSDSADPRPLVLVTGAAGRVGRRVLPVLIARGYRIRATARRPPASTGPAAPFGPSSNPAIQWIALDLRTARPPDYRSAVDGCAAVVHLAASRDARTTMPAVNAGATGALAVAAEDAGVTTLCYLSSVAVYGSPRRRDIDELSPVLTTEHLVRDEYRASARRREYGRTKLLGEQLLGAAAGTCRYTILRPTVIVDVPDLVALRDWSRVQRLRAAHRHAHHLFIGDVADAIAWSVARGLAGVVGPGVIETFDLHDDDVPGPLPADFLRQAYAATGDRRCRVARLPGILVRVVDAIRPRSGRRSLGRIRFRSTAMHDAGWRRPCGMTQARAEAIDRLRAERSGPDGGSVEASAPAATAPPAVSDPVTQARSS